MKRDIKTINELLLYCIQGHKASYVSTDRACYDEDQLQMPVETLNTIGSGFLPPHVLDLKIGSPIVIRSIDPAAGVCNGTRLIVNFLGTNVIEAIIATGPKAGNIALIPKIKFITLATEGVSPYDIERIQFPVRLAFAMNINKSQGQTLGYISLSMYSLSLPLSLDTELSDLSQIINDRSDLSVNLHWASCAVAFKKSMYCLSFQLSTKNVYIQNNAQKSYILK